MYFKRMEIHGFKSFADPVIIDFNEGITCIVGPNGSGKSNISDALRWVLGEQSPKQLRGGKMEEVIFSGTESRRPRGMAEVTLVIDNSAGILDIDYSEVAVTRRMYRNGESEYLINGNACRLRDIRSLFMDTGIGVDGYSIIGQGKIADILSNKPESRREIFEESAGIVAYKTRKNEAERKLTAANENLARIEDIIGELEKRVVVLKEESAKAERYLEIKDRYRDIEVNVTLKNIENTQAANEKSKSDIADLNGKVLFVTENKRKSETEKIDVARRADTLDKLISEAHAQMPPIVAAISDCKNEEQYTEQRLADINREKERVSHEIEEIKALVSESEEEIARLGAEREQLRSEVFVSDGKLKQNQMLYDRLSGETSGANRVVDDGNNKLFELHSEVASKKSEAKSIESYKSTLENRQRQIKGESESLAGLIRSYRTQLQEEENKKRFAEKDKERISKELAETDRERRAAEEELPMTRKAIEALRVSVGEKEARRRTIEEMEHNYEGYSSAVRYMMQSGISGIEGVAADMLDVPQGLELAIETALGSARQNIIIDTDRSAKKAVNALKHNKAGRLTFLPVESITASSIDPGDEIRRDPGFIGMGVDVVEFRERYRTIFRYLLGRAVIVRDLDSAIRLSKISDTRLRFVTVEGEIVNATGAITGGRFRNQAAPVIGRKNEIARLKNEIETAGEELRKKEIRVKAIEADLGRYDIRLAELHRGSMDIELAASSIDPKISAITDSIAEAENRIKKNDAELATISEELAKTDSMVRTLLDGSKAAEAEIARVSSEIESAMTEYEARRQAVDEAGAALSQSQLEASELMGRLNNVESILARAKVELEALRAREDDRARLAQDLAREEDSLKMSSGDSGAQILRLEQDRYALEEKIADLTREKSRVSEKERTITEEIRQFESEANAYTEQRFRLELMVAKGETQLENMKEKLWSDFELSYAQALSMKWDEISLSSAVKESRELRNELKRLGDVNVGSIREFEVENERYGFLCEQREDVTTAKNELESIIDDMDKRITRKFRESFEQVQKEFKEVFSELFKGGHAELRLENEKDPLTSGIEIVAQPPGKKLQNINLLSGGEKTMTAIALMFAVLKVRPTPFCILDEVEAALDEENIDRFSGYLRNFDKTQFALITHQRATMEHADSLYGITMAEQGISKVLSLKFGDYDAAEFTE